MFWKKPNRELIFRYQYEKATTYDYKTIYKKISPKKLLHKITYDKINNPYITIDCKYLDEYYLFYDIDDYNKYNNFISNYQLPCAIFQSSPGHHWVIVDNPRKKISEHLENHDWICYSDLKHVNFSQNIKKFVILGVFDDLKRQPKLIEFRGGCQ